MYRELWGDPRFGATMRSARGERQTGPRSAPRHPARRGVRRAAALVSISFRNASPEPTGPPETGVAYTATAF